ncbi:hypothetical protein ACOTH4_09465 [Achromobacter xylosoxidans]
MDWTAFAALTALEIWLHDGYRRRRERRASRRLLAQIMVTPVAAAQIEITKLRCLVVPPGGEDVSYLLAVLADQARRKGLAAEASLITFELPAQFLDKADIFSEVVSNRLALAFAQVSRLRTMALFLGELPDSANQEEIIQSLKLFLAQIQETERIVDEALQALLKEGKASPIFFYSK